MSLCCVAFYKNGKVCTAAAKDNQLCGRHTNYAGERQKVQQTKEVKSRSRSTSTTKRPTIAKLSEEIAQLKGLVLLLCKKQGISEEELSSLSIPVEKEEKKSLPSEDFYSASDLEDIDTSSDDKELAEMLGEKEVVSPPPAISKNKKRREARKSRKPITEEGFPFEEKKEKPIIPPLDLTKVKGPAKLSEEFLTMLPCKECKGEFPKYHQGSDGITGYADFVTKVGNGYICNQCLKKKAKVVEEKKTKTVANVALLPLPITDRTPDAVVSALPPIEDLELLPLVAAPKQTPPVVEEKEEKKDDRRDPPPSSSAVAIEKEEEKEEEPPILSPPRIPHPAPAITNKLREFATAQTLEEEEEEEEPPFPPKLSQKIKEYNENPPSSAAIDKLFSRPLRRELEKVECDNCGEKTHHPKKWPEATLCGECSNWCVVTDCPDSSEIPEAPVPVCQHHRSIFPDEDLSSFVEERKYNRQEDKRKCKDCKTQLTYLENYRYLHDKRFPLMCSKCICKYVTCSDCGGKFTPEELETGECNNCNRVDKG